MPIRPEILARQLNVGELRPPTVPPRVCDRPDHTDLTGYLRRVGKNALVSFAVVLLGPSPLSSPGVRNADRAEVGS